MAKVFFVVVAVALIALQGVLAKPKAKQAEQSPIDELVRNTQSLVNNVTHTLGIDDLPDSKKIIDSLNNNAQKLATDVQSIVDKLKNELKNHKDGADDVIKQVEAKLSETANSLQQAVGPDATNKAKELKKNLDDGLKTAVAQVEKLVKAVEPDVAKARTGIHDAAQTLLNQITNISNNIQTQVKDSIAEHEKTHQH